MARERTVRPGIPVSISLAPDGIRTDSLIKYAFSLIPAEPVWLPKVEREVQDLLPLLGTIPLDLFINQIKPALDMIHAVRLIRAGHAPIPLPPWCATVGSILECLGKGCPPLPSVGQIRLNAFEFTGRPLVDGRPGPIQRLVDQLIEIGPLPQFPEGLRPPGSGAGTPRTALPKTRLAGQPCLQSRHGYQNSPRGCPDWNRRSGTWRFKALRRSWTPCCGKPVKFSGEPVLLTRKRIARKRNQVPEPPIRCPSNRSRILRTISRSPGRVIGGHVCF